MDKILIIIPLLFYYIAAICIYIILLKLGSKNKRIRMPIMAVLCLLDFIFYLINDYYFYIRGDNILTMLPLQLCNIAVFLLPLAVFTKKRLIYDFVFYICAPGGLAAVLIPSNDYIGIPYSLMTASFFIFHCIIIVLPFLAVKWKIYDPFPTVKKALQLSMMVFSFAGVMHLLNLYLGNFGIKANYFFTIIKYSAPTNPAFAFFSKIIPIDFLYLLPALPVLYFYMLAVYLILNFSRKTEKNFM